MPNRACRPSRRAAPSRYVLDYPAADRFCPPIRSTFAEVTQTFLVVRGHRFSQRPNGGYGVAMGQKIGKKHLLHVGADLGWFQDGEPVYAVANGVVRIGQGVLPADRHERDQEKPTRAPLMWGNLIVVEHRLPDHGDFFFTVYGHLGTDRLVRVGDIVQAGQPIGTIGRRKVNGGYSPHLHFGVGRGRLAEEGMTLFSLHGTTKRRRSRWQLWAKNRSGSMRRTPYPKGSRSMGPNTRSHDAMTSTSSQATCCTS